VAGKREKGARRGKSGDGTHAQLREGNLGGESQGNAGGKEFSKLRERFASGRASRGNRPNKKKEAKNSPDGKKKTSRRAPLPVRASPSVGTSLVEGPAQWDMLKKATRKGGGSGTCPTRRRKLKGP